ncbi:MAG TPA: phosphoribosylamine--glycine ligase, partial [Vicinamibacterales bacterium]|jgi:phosphoribosylamine--glycine ligase|nr:phosphoribosylamine--glycine ligase [Vicinamibacterales bacterium]
MRVLVVGSGAREHALALRLLADPHLDELIAAPGNPGLSHLVRTVAVDVMELDSLVALADRERIDLTVVGPEAPLSVGLADRFAAAGRLIVGPTAAAARLESSKAFAKAFMQRHHVPTARFRTCTTLADALASVHAGELGWPVVLKADGLAAGKGVVIAEDCAAAESVVVDAMRDHRFGAAGECLVIEECLTGPEVSFFVLTDGARALCIGTAQDHKRIFDDDRGPNTGGMGAFASSPLVTPDLAARITRDIVDPVVRGMAAEGHPYAGFLYVGAMLTPEGPKVIEFNARLGDPEAQVILPLIDEPLLPLLAASASGTLNQTAVRISADRMACVVLASRGYPGSSESGRPISGVAEAARVAGVTVYHAGTAMKDGRLITSGGRVLTVAARGADFSEAIARAYAAVLKISFDGMQYRRDIGRKALEPRQ